MEEKYFSLSSILKYVLDSSMRVSNLIVSFNCILGENKAQYLQVGAVLGENGKKESQSYQQFSRKEGKKICLLILKQGRLRLTVAELYKNHGRTDGTNEL